MENLKSVIVATLRHGRLSAVVESTQLACSIYSEKKLGSPQEVDIDKDNYPFHTNESLLLHYTENMFQFYTYKKAYDLADLLKAFLNAVKHL
jgi:hypothetical protein